MMPTLFVTQVTPIHVMLYPAMAWTHKNEVMLLEAVHRADRIYGQPLKSQA